MNLAWKIHNWATVFRAGFLLLLCLNLNACQHKEPYAESEQLHPQISIDQSRPTPLHQELVVNQIPPMPVQSPHVTPEIEKQRSGGQLALTSVQLSPAVQTAAVEIPTSLTNSRSGLLVALEHYLDQHHDAAVAALQQYPRDDREAALVMLPYLARMEQGENWNTLNGAQKLAILESFRSLIRRLSMSAPLVLQNVSLVEDQPQRFGEVKPRTNSNYYPEDWVHAYAELVNLIDHTGGDGKRQVRLEVTLELHGPRDKIYWTDTKPFEKTGSISSRNDYHVAASFTLPKQLMPGMYQLHLYVVDRDTNRKAHDSLPLHVLESRGRVSNKRK